MKNTTAMADYELRHIEALRKDLAGCTVLLKKDGSFPLEKPCTLAAYGSGVRRTIRGGTGSGEVNSRYTVTIEEGLQQAGFTLTGMEWHTGYEQAREKAHKAFLKQLKKDAKAAKQNFILYGMGKVMPEPEYDLPLNAEGDAAIYVVSRISGEGNDRTPLKGDIRLTDSEVRDILALDKKFTRFMLVLNVGGVVDLSPVMGVRNILLLSQLGVETGGALADILLGKANPSGKLTTTWAAFEEYPEMPDFEDMNETRYREGIYVGYRYFDSFNITPAYPFGFGGSYTTFALEVKDVALDGETVCIRVNVQNTGSRYAGRETVQVYLSQPQGKLDKPYQVLAGFAKTGSLAPGQCETVTVTFPLHILASYDEEQAVWLLEKGVYYLRVGSHSRSTCIAAALELGETVVTARLQNRLQPDCPLETLRADPARFCTYPEEAREKAAAPRLTVAPASIPCETTVYSQKPSLLHTEKEQTVTLQDVVAGQATLEDLVTQLTPPELAGLVVGSARGGFGSTSVIGVASTACPGAAGETTSTLLESRGVQNLVLADGPAGLRLSRSFVADSQGNIIPGLGDSAFGNLGELLGIVPPPRPADAVDHYQYCTAIPIATMLAQTWDPALMEEAGDIVGGEMEDFGVTLWLAPGMNIQRNPLCGRNFEYYSEDPLLSGLCAAADTRGVQRHPGCGTTIKHFALNNQEDNRNHNNAHCTERALREIYLKGFEIAVRTAQPLALMSSYNLVNGIHSANNRELLTDILRDEWGFAGLVMTDWGTTDASTGFKYGSSATAGCVLAGNDLTMPGSQQDVDAILDALKAGTLPLAALQQCARRVLALAAHCQQARQNTKA